MMDPKKMIEQVMNFNKTTFDSAINTMSTLQEQADKIVDMTISQFSGLPEEGKNAINGWIESCKKGREDFKQVVTENFTKVSEFVDGAMEKK